MTVKRKTDSAGVPVGDASEFAGPAQQRSTRAKAARKSDAVVAGPGQTAAAASLDSEKKPAVNRAVQTANRKPAKAAAAAAGATEATSTVPQEVAKSAVSATTHASTAAAAASNGATAKIDPVRDHDEIARIAYSFWERRGSHGGHEGDWFRAIEVLQQRRTG